MPAYTYKVEKGVIQRNDGLKSDDPILGIKVHPELWPQDLLLAPGVHVTYDWDGPSQGVVQEESKPGHFLVADDGGRGVMEWPAAELTVGYLQNTGKGYTTVPNKVSAEVDKKALFKKKMQEFGWKFESMDSPYSTEVEDLPGEVSEELDEIWVPPDNANLGAFLDENRVLFVTDGYPQGTAHSDLELGNLLSRFGYSKSSQPQPTDSIKVGSLQQLGPLTREALENLVLDMVTNGGMSEEEAIETFTEACRAARQNEEVSLGYREATKIKGSLRIAAPDTGDRYRTEVKRDKWGATIAFHDKGYLGTAPSAHARLTNEDIEKILALPPNGGTYTWKDEQKITWAAGHDGTQMHIVCQSPIHFGGNAHVPLTELKANVTSAVEKTADGGFEPEVDHVGAFWLVTKPTPVSELIDCCSLFHLGTFAQNVKGGLVLQDIVAVLKKEEQTDAEALAQELMRKEKRKKASKTAGTDFEQQAEGILTQNGFQQLGGGDDFVQYSKGDWSVNLFIDAFQLVQGNNKPEIVGTSVAELQEALNKLGKTGAAPPRGAAVEVHELPSLKCYDDGGKTIDRYTIVFMDQPEGDGTYPAIGAGSDATSPQGFWQHTTAMPGEHLGTEIPFEKLPKPIQERVWQEVAESEDPTLGGTFEEEAAIQEVDKRSSEEFDKAMRPFEKTDWYGWAGAESFDDGTEPYIAYLPVASWPDEGEHGMGPTDVVTLIVDKNGIAANGSNAAFNRDGGTREQNLALAQKIIAQGPVGYHHLLALGLKPSNFPNDDEIAAQGKGVKQQEASSKKASNQDQIVSYLEQNGWKFLDGFGDSVSYFNPSQQISIIVYGESNGDGKWFLFPGNLDDETRYPGAPKDSDITKIGQGLDQLQNAVKEPNQK